MAKIDTIDLYAVENFYHQEGYMQQIARSDWFSYLTLLVISMNAVYIGVSEQWNESDTLLESDLVFQLFDHFFCGAFMLELIVRFCAFRHKSDSLRDSWFRFDALLVFLSIFDTWQFQPPFNFSLSFFLRGLSLTDLLCTGWVHPGRKKNT